MLGETFARTVIDKHGGELRAGWVFYTETGGMVGGGRWKFMSRYNFLAEVNNSVFM